MKYTVLVNGDGVPSMCRSACPCSGCSGMRWTSRAPSSAAVSPSAAPARCCWTASPIRSCVTPISSVGTGPVTTIESLPRNGSHPLQRAWLELDVPQCGYCQAGQLMAASALLKATPNPTDQQIDTAMSGNVCRCGTYIRIKQAIKSAASAGRRG